LLFTQSAPLLVLVQQALSKRRMGLRHQYGIQNIHHNIYIWSYSAHIVKLSHENKKHIFESETLCQPATSYMDPVVY
jgi:hypothetical protein